MDLKHCCLIKTKSSRVKTMFNWTVSIFRKTLIVAATLLKFDLRIEYTTFLFLPNQELSVLYGGPTLNYGGQLSLYFPHMLLLNMTRDLAHLQLSDLQGEIRSICRRFELQGERTLIRRTYRLLSLLK